jgi:protein-S-isoprenylcysteine O-methyltransferase Ste14
MQRLELKIPPLALVVLFAIAMMGIAYVFPPLAMGLAQSGWWIGIPVVVIGAFTCIAGVIGFRRARTTVDPTRPEATSALVTGGIYRFTRNPMYLGFLLMLLGTAFAADNWLALILAFLFVPYMNRWQIGPEERILTEKFGGEFAAYRGKVRRWI